MSQSLPSMGPHHRCPWWIQYLLASPLRQLLEPADRLIGPDVGPGMTVVEPGCGFGHVSLALARRVGPSGRVLCVDVEPRVVERLVRRARKAGLEGRIQASACGSRDLGLAAHAGQVDRVMAIHVAHELEDLPGFLAQVCALLRPEGRLRIVEPRHHVSAAAFDDTLRTCAAHGLVEVDAPALPRRRLEANLALAREG